MRLVLLLVLSACATAPVPLPPAPVERSSIDVLLAHRAELALTEAQVDRLEAMELALQARLDPLRAELAELSRASTAARPPPPDRSRFSAGTPSGFSPRRGAPAYEPLGPPREDPVQQVLARMDDADTGAFRDARSEVLTEAQRPAAEALASRFRAALFDYRQARRARREPLE